MEYSANQGSLATKNS